LLRTISVDGHQVCSAAREYGSVAGDGGRKWMICQVPFFFTVFGLESNKVSLFSSDIYSAIRTKGYILRIIGHGSGPYIRQGPFKVTVA